MTRSSRSKMRGQVDAFGQIIGGPPIGYIGTAFSNPAALVAASAILSPVLLLYAYAAHKTREKLTQPS
jgi:MFS transporter, DHA3 family, tetracycline resistance protein